MADKTKVHSILFWEDVHPNVFQFGELSNRLRPDGIKSDKVYLLNFLSIDRGDLDEIFTVAEMKEVLELADKGEIERDGDRLFVPGRRVSGF